MIKLFLIDREKNEATSIRKKTFQELKFSERQHLQEWISKNPDILGEDLLIIQKEFSGFDDTRERLDLLAVDKEGNLVIIECKLDDSGRDVVWQSLKYASYCSSLTKNDVREIFQSYLDKHTDGGTAETILCEFFQVENFNEVVLNHGDQRIIMVAANFRKEVTSTVLWLLEHDIKLKCIKVTPYELDGKVFLDTDQIIPITDAEEYLIQIANKKKEEEQAKKRNQRRYIVRAEFWKELLEDMNQQSNLFQNVGPTKDGWLGCGSGYSGILYTMVVTGSYVRVELWIIGRSQSENKEIFDDLYERKKAIETKFGEPLDWQRLDSGKGSRVAYSLTDVSVYNCEDWKKIIEFLTSYMIKLEESLNGALKEVMRK